MIEAENNSIYKISAHRVGNKTNNEGNFLSKSGLDVSDEIATLLVAYFITPFRSNEYFHFYHDIDNNMNEVFVCASTIFDNPDSLHEQSMNLAKHLYEQTTHPKIKTGEFYVVYFKDCLLDDEVVDAIGLFKSENKDTFLKVQPLEDCFEIDSQQGININKLDKGCLIFNTEREKGYIVAVVDSIGKGSEAHYWIDDFLHLRQRKDGYYHTQSLLSITKNFVTKELPKAFDVSKADQAELLNKSVQFFKEKETFDIEEFANQVIAQPEVIDCFNRYKEDYQQEREMKIDDSFIISDAAVKKQARAFKSVIKLDKNFHIYVHGNKQYIQKGYDQATGMHYYQLFFKEEE